MANDPYFIANWTITGSPTHGIFIMGTTKHFSIEFLSELNEQGLHVTITIQEQLIGFLSCSN